MDRKERFQTLITAHQPCSPRIPADLPTGGYAETLMSCTHSTGPKFSDNPRFNNRYIGSCGIGLSPTIDTAFAPIAAPLTVQAFRLSLSQVMYPSFPEAYSKPYRE